MKYNLPGVLCRRHEYVLLQVSKGLFCTEDECSSLFVEWKSILEGGVGSIRTVVPLIAKPEDPRAHQLFQVWGNLRQRKTKLIQIESTEKALAFGGDLSIRNISKKTKFQTKIIRCS